MHLLPNDLICSLQYIILRRLEYFYDYFKQYPLFHRLLVLYVPSGNIYLSGKILFKFQKNRFLLRNPENARSLLVTSALTYPGGGLYQSILASRQLLGVSSA